MSLLFALGKTTLLFLPGKGQDHRVAQVTLNTVGETQGGTVDTIASFFLVQHQVSELITRVVKAHQTQPLATPVPFAGDQYTLVANKKPWAYGATLKLGWGDERVQPCADKWTFTFSLAGA
ncbi:hypothetical protein M0805_003515 [Coniferiporia weirii]|nr:hypothetical protein M0805_003515 [Coniferiporia weirii]